MSLPSTMRAAVFHGPHDVRVEEVPTPDEIGPDDNFFDAGGHCWTPPLPCAVMAPASIPRVASWRAIPPFPC